MAVLASYSDGALRTNSQVQVSLEPSGLLISQLTRGSVFTPMIAREFQLWPYASLSTISYHIGGGLKLSSFEADRAQLYISDGVFCAALTKRAPQLLKRQVPKNFVRAGKFLGMGTVLLATAIYVTLNFLPSLLQPIVPSAWTKTMSAQLEQSLIAGNRKCTTPEGEAAFAKILSHLAEGNTDLPPVQISVYDLDYENAFAIAGGKILVTRGLLENATGPEEVAGILAHEFGHAHYKHPETSLIRVMGTDMLLSAVTATGGNGSGVTMSSLAAVLQYNQRDEAAADDYAYNTLVASRIDPQGARHFFERALKKDAEMKNHSNVLSKLEQIYSTHPRTEGRMDKFGPLPEGVIELKIMGDSDWQALKNICNETGDNSPQADDESEN